MKKSNLTIQIEDEKLQALRLFAGKKDTSVESELDDAVQKLYEKYVPKDARELVELMTGGSDAPTKPRPAKAVQPKGEAKKPDGSTSAGNTGQHEPAKQQQP